jgi:hypothetical protein
VAVIIAVAFVKIVPAVAAKLAVVEPAGTVTEAGSDSSELLLDRPTEAPPLGAGLETFTVQALDCPVLRVAGAHARLVTVGRVPA